MKMPMFRSMAALLAGLLCISCSLPRQYLYVEGKGRIAVASFFLNKSIVEEGTEKSHGPGLLQNKEKYYLHHQEAVEAMWTQAKDSIGAVFGKAEFIPFGDVFSNQKYIELTTYAPIKMLGLSMVPGEDELFPQGCRYVSGHDKKTLQALCGALGADFVLIFENQAAVRFTRNELSIGNTGLSRKGIIVLTTALTLYHKTDGYVWSMTVTTKSDSEGRIINNEIDPALFPQLLSEAQGKLWTSIRDEVALGRKKADEGVVK